MRFQCHLPVLKLKPIEPILNLSLNLLKARVTKFSIYLIYTSAQNEIRMLIQSELTPIVIVLNQEMFTKLVSTSKNQTTNSSIGFEFKNGLLFLEDLLLIIREEADKGLIGEERIVFMKVAKDREFRSLEIKTKDKLRRAEIQKPSKNESELFTYEWIDGVTRSLACLQLNPSGIIQILKVVSKSKSHYIIQILQQKKLQLIIDIENAKLQVRLKHPQSAVQTNTKFIRIEGPTQGRYQYQIKIDDAEILLFAIKNECVLVIGEDKRLSLSYSSASYNCQIGLWELVHFVGVEGFLMGLGVGGVKREMEMF